MAHDLVDPKARVWTITLGLDGKLRAVIDAKRLAALRSCERKRAA